MCRKLFSSFLIDMSRQIKVTVREFHDIQLAPFQSRWHKFGKAKQKRFQKSLIKEKVAALSKKYCPLKGDNFVSSSAQRHLKYSFY
jgi:hypothetical protein